MKQSIDYFIPKQDPILGIKATNLVEELNLYNWLSKAVGRCNEGIRQYVYLSEATDTRARKRYYCVTRFNVDSGLTHSKTLFIRPEQALAFANQGNEIDLLPTTYPNRNNG